MIRKVHKTKDEFDSQKAGNNQPNPFKALLRLITGFFNCLAVRLLLIFSIAMLLSCGISDLLYPQIVKSKADKLVAVSASTLDSRSLTDTIINSYAGQTQAAWCYVTAKSHKNTITFHSNSLPSTVTSNLTSHILTVKGHQYYQTTAQLRNGNVLHIAFPLPDPFLPNLASGDLGQIYLPAQYVFMLCGGIFIFLLILLDTWVARPLNRLAKAAHSFVSLRNVSTFVDGSLDVPGAVTEVQKIREELVELRHQYDDLNLARVTREAEVRKLKSTHEKEKSTLVTGYKQQLSTTQQELSELRTKEVEEEFITSLSHELDLIRSSQQLCDRVLEKVNNKYPSSIVFGAFFRVYESLNYELVSHLSFDAPSIQILRKINHFNIAQQIFDSGQYLHISHKAMAENGLAALAERNDIKHAVYMPLIFQQRHLGMFAFYIVPEDINTQELFRTLKNVCDIAARELYQLILYEEAATAARTDLLTDLPNRKFLEEIFPVILDRASASSTPREVSAIVIHLDQLRSIADNSGRIAVDRMLKELARVLKEHMGSSPLMQERETHLVRFATEDFVLILDQTDLACATKIAEQIKETVESRSTWPGGIASLTVSQGISSYPDDGITPAELITSAEAALLYGKEVFTPGCILHAQTVPEEYRATKNLAIDGNLAVFDAGGLLQSVATSQKTGVLTVESSSGKQLWVLFENGKPAQARLGKLKADHALIEFIVTFEDGVFSFQETGGQGAKLPRLDDTFNIKASLDRVVMDGALAQDNYRAAIDLVTSLDEVLQSADADVFNTRWEKLKGLDSPPTQREYEILEEIIKRADGNNTLTQILKLLDATPTYLVWYCLAMLLRLELLIPNGTPKTASSTAV